MKTLIKTTKEDETPEIRSEEVELIDLKAAAFELAKRSLFVSFNEDGKESHIIAIDLFSNLSRDEVIEILKESFPNGYKRFKVKALHLGAFHRDGVSIYRKKI